MKKYYKRLISLLGGDNLEYDFLLITAVHVLIMLATGLSTVFISVFLFKMNNSDYILTAKYNAATYIFEITAFVMALFFLKRFSITKNMRIGLFFYALAYCVLLVFRNDLINYYVFVAFFTSTGSGFYWSCHYIMMNQHTTSGTRQRALGFLGISCYIVSTIASPISGTLTKYLPGIWGYIAVFSITIMAFVLASFIAKKIACEETNYHHVRFHKSLKYVFTNKGPLFVFSSEFIRGMRDGLTLYYVTILLYFATSNEFIIGISLLLKNLMSIICFYYIKSIKTSKQRVFSTALSIFLEIILCMGILLTFDLSVNSIIIFIYSFLFNLVTVLSVNNFQIPLFDAMILLKNHCDAELEFVAVKQVFLNSGRALGVILLLFLPTNPKFAVILIIITSVLALLSTFVCGVGAKIMSNEVRNG